MKIIFAGTPDFAVPTLAALIAADHEVVLVLTQPDRPAGRGMKLKASPVKELALQHGLPVYQPEKLKTAESQAPVAAVEADVMVVAAYGLRPVELIGRELLLGLEWDGLDHAARPKKKGRRSGGRRRDHDSNRQPRTPHLPRH